MATENLLELNFVFEQDKDGGFCGICLELNVASEGDTLEAAKENLFDAVKLYLTYALDSGKFQEMVPRPVPDYIRARLRKGNNTVDTVRSKFNLPDTFKKVSVLGPETELMLLHV